LIAVSCKKLKLSSSRCPEYDTITITHHIVHGMLNLLYGNDVAIDDRTLSYDLDMGHTLPISKVKNARCDYEILFNDPDAKDNDAIDSRHILAICDKLALSDIINGILDDISPIPYTSLIINHTLSNNAMIKLYAKTSAYNLLYECIHYFPYYGTRDNTLEHDMFRDATLNGLRVTNISVHDKFINDNHIQYCTSLTTLQIHDSGCKITTYTPFAKSLKVLHVRNKFGDEKLEMCTSIVELYASDNDKITTCAPFAKSLEVLNASGCCGIGNSGLVSCNSIKKLIASYNTNITTCEPFAKTLKVLHANGSNCKITDVGIASCQHIEKLHAFCNSKITTCAPFAKSLTHLVAVNSCGITDIGISMCQHIEKLHASNNSKITTCAPFAESLTYLDAENNCGITNIGISTCQYIEELHASNNSKITTCAPFAKSLKRLIAMGMCGINNAGIASCYSLEYLDVSHNLIITTCTPFAKSLRCLYACNKSGMNTKEVLRCKSLIELHTIYNDKVDPSKITMAKK